MALGGLTMGKIEKAKTKAKAKVKAKINAKKRKCK